MDIRKKKAFLVLKDMFTKKSILTIFNPKKKIIIEIDINRIVLSAILSQLNKKDRLYPVTFYSRNFTTSELNYDIYDKKLLIIVNSFKI